MSGYLSEQEFYAFGLPARAFVSGSMLVTSVDVTANTLTVPGHGLADDDVVRFVANAGGGGVAAGVLPAPLSASSLSYAKVVGADMLQVAAAPGGAAIDLTTAGTPVFGIVKDPRAWLLAQIEARSRHADQHLTAHSTPLTSAPLQLKMWIAHLVALDAMTSRGLLAPEFASDPSLAERAKAAQAQLDVLRRTAAELVGAVDLTPGVADGGAVSWGDPSRDWTHGGVVP